MRDGMTRTFGVYCIIVMMRMRKRGESNRTTLSDTIVDCQSHLISCVILTFIYVLYYIPEIRVAKTRRGVLNGFVTARWASPSPIHGLRSPGSELEAWKVILFDKSRRILFILNTQLIKPEPRRLYILPWNDMTVTE